MGDGLLKIDLGQVPRVSCGLCQNLGVYQWFSTGDSAAGIFYPSHHPGHIWAWGDRQMLFWKISTSELIRPQGFENHRARRPLRWPLAPVFYDFEVSLQKFHCTKSEATPPRASGEKKRDSGTEKARSWAFPFLQLCPTVHGGRWWEGSRALLEFFFPWEPFELRIYLFIYLILLRG